LCFPSYVVITDFRSCDALSTCFQQSEVTLAFTTVLIYKDFH